MSRIPTYYGPGVLAKALGTVPGAITNAVNRGTIRPDAWRSTGDKHRTPLFTQATITKLRRQKGLD